MKNIFTILILVGLMAPLAMLSQEVEVHFPTPTTATLCGAPGTVNVTVTNNSSENINTLMGQFTLLVGASLFNLSTTAGDPAIDAGSNNYTLPDLDIGESVSFTLDLALDCDGTDGSIDFILDYQDINGLGQVVETNTMTVTTADLQVSATAPASITTFDGNTESISSTLTNTGDGEAQQLDYCVGDNPNASIQSVTFTVGGNTVTLSSSTSVLGGSCFTLGNTEFQTLFGQDAFQPGDAISVTESWLITNCSPSLTQLTRKAQVGCEGVENCRMMVYENPVELTVNTFVYGFSIDVISPEEITSCGPVESIEITVNHTAGPNDILTDLTAYFDLPAGIVLVGIMGPASLEVSSDSIRLDDPLGPGESVTFSLQVRGTCGLVSGSFEIPFSLRHSPLPCVLTSGQEDETGIIAGQLADLSMPGMTNPSVIQLYPTLEFDITTTVANGGNGILDTMFYCLEDHPNTAIQSIIVGNVTISTPFSMDDGFTCFAITSDAFQDVFGEPFLPDNMSFEVKETWLATSCATESPDLRRRVQFGCEGERDCQAKDQGVYPNTALVFNTLFPDLDASVTSASYPECFWNDPTDIEVTITNNGNSPAEDIVIDLSIGAGALIPGSYTVMVPDGNGGIMPVADPTLENISNDAPGSCTGGGIGALQDVLSGLILEVGESIVITYQIDHSCSAACSFSDVYYSVVQVSYEDLCDEPFNSSTSSADYDTQIIGFPEAPINLDLGEKATVEFTVNSLALDWFDGNYPDAYIETVIDIPSGLDYTALSVQWIDIDGTVWPICLEDYTDSDGGTDEVTVRWCYADQPPNFSISSGSSFVYCVMPDCNEMLPPSDCANPVFEVLLRQEFFQVTDPDCVPDCSMPFNKIGEVAPTSMFVRCPTGGCAGGGGCEGVDFNSLKVERANFGFPDGNNNQDPDGTLDLNLVQRDRFLPGDTLKATFQGVIRDLSNNMWADGYASIQFPFDEFTPIGAQIYYETTGGTIYNCNVVPLSVDVPNRRIIADFSLATLDGLGCGINPSDLIFSNGDSISLCMFFELKRPFSGMEDAVVFESEFFVTNGDYGTSPAFQCDERQARLTQIGIRESKSCSFDSFGSCDLPTWSIRHSLHYGFADFDEFPYEVRPLGIPQQITFEKPSEFVYRADAFGIQLVQEIMPARNLLDIGNQTIPSEYIIENGNELTILTADYLNSLGLSTISPDEGFSIYYYPKIQGACESIASPPAYEMTYSQSFAVDANVFCTPLLTAEPVNKPFTYEGGAELAVFTDFEEIRLCSAEERVPISVVNISSSTAPNAFIYVTSASGALIPVQLIDPATQQELPEQGFGIFPLGDLASGEMLELEVAVIPNSCELEELQFVTGWDCESLPTAIEEALCSTPSTIAFTTADAGMALDILDPVMNRLDEFCDTIIYEAEIRSTDLGYLRNISVDVILPPSVIYVPNSFEMAYPAVSQLGSYMSFATDPVIPIPNGFRVFISEQDPILSTIGLVGSKNLTQNKVNIRFQTMTECGYLNKSQVRFILKADNTCGDPLPIIKKRTGRIRVTNQEPDFQVEISQGNLELNPCASESEELFISINLLDGMVDQADSVRITLPPGIIYVPGSYENLGMVANTPPNERFENGGQVLVWPFSAISEVGTTMTFKIELMAIDIGQECTEYDLLVEAFATTSLECNGTVCNIGLVAGEAVRSVTISKPELTFIDFSANLTLQPSTNDAQGDFVVTILNEGATLPSGEVIQLEVYEDTDQNGERSNGDGLLYTIMETLTSPLETGESVTIMDQATFPAGAICTLIAVLNPSSTCTCSEEPSFQVRPEISIDFLKDYTVCSEESPAIEIGPEALTGYQYEWLSINGSPINSDPLNPVLDDATTTPTTFSLANTTGSDLNLQYALRTSYAECYVYDTINITVFSANMDEVFVQACLNAPFDLPSQNLGGSDFVWVPTTGLSFPGPDPTFARIDNVTGNATYTLTYLDGNGCPASYVVQVDAVDCGTAVTGLGDTVWFDFNQDGLQSLNEPGIEDVVVNLYNATDGSIISSTVTDANGYYEFTNLPQGSYYVGFVPLPGFVGTTANALGNSQDAEDSDADPNTGLTGAYFLPWDTFNPTVDAGFIPTCELDIEVELGDCEIVGTEVLRTVMVTVAWQDNPYTYDQFGFIADTLEVSFLGETYRVIADTLFGESTITTMVNPSVNTPLIVTAAFVLDTECTAMATGPTLTPCVFDLALTKDVANGPSFIYGDTICLDITVFNQGEQAVSNIELNDYLPAGFGFLPDLNPQWMDIGGGVIRGLITDTISVDEQLILPLKVELLMATGTDVYTNVAEINSFQDTLGTDFSNFDIDSTPDDVPDNDPGGEPESPADNEVNGNGTGIIGGSDPGTDEDDQDPWRLNVFDLALIKTIETSPPYSFGQTITFAIELTNQGNVTAQNIEVIDYIPAGFAWLASNEPLWDFSSASPYSFATTTVPGPLAPGETTTVFIDLTLQPAAIDQFVNIAEISGAEDDNDNPRFDDIDSTPDEMPGNDAGGNSNSDSDNVNNGDGTGTPGDSNPATDEDDQDPAYVTVSDLAVTKSAISVVPANTPGHFLVTYEVIMENTGNTILTELQLSDDLVSQFGTSFVAINSDPAILGASTAQFLPSLNISFTGNTVNPDFFIGTDGELLPSQNVIVQLTVEVTGLTGASPLTNQVNGAATDPFDETIEEEDTEEVFLPICFLDVDCPNSNGGTFACLADVPAGVTTVASFNSIDGFSVIHNACGPLTITFNDTDNGGMGCPGSPLIITRIYTISDPGNGMTSPETEQCTIIYTVLDEDAPQLICPDPITVDCDLSGVPVYSAVVDFVAAGGFVADNCAVTGFQLLTENSDNNACPEVVTRTYQATDACGNTSTCEQLITVVDTEKPAVTCIPLESNCLGDDIPPYTTLSEFLIAGNVASDNCGIDPNSFTLVSEDTLLFGCPIVIERLYQVTDLCGNVSCCGKQLISYVDEEAPVFTILPSDETISCSDAVPSPPVLTAMDNCGVTPTITMEESSTQTDDGLCSDNDYLITRTWTARDVCGNATQVTQRITVQDMAPPTPVCCPAFTISIGSEVDGVITINPSDIDCGSTDNCAPMTDPQLSVSPNNLTIANLGVNPITLTVTDACGNTSECVTEVTVIEEPEIGIAKRLVELVNNPDGSATVTYEFNVENLGDVLLTDVQVTDDLLTTFQGDCTIVQNNISSSFFQVNGSYTGTGNNNLLLGGDDLPVGQQGSILLTITISDCGTNNGPFLNQAEVTANSLGGFPLDDLSTDGSNPDPNGDGNPDEQIMTPVSPSQNPLLGVAKRLSEGPTNNEDGTYNMTFELRVENLGDVAIGDIQLTEDLATTFGSAASWELLSVESEEFTVSSTYNGASDTELLTGLDTLTSGNEGAVYVTVRVEPGSTLTGYTNQVTATGTSPSGEMLEDDSTNGSDPDPNNDGNPDEMVETPIDFTEDAVLGVAKRLSEGPTNNEDGSYDMTFELRVENLGDVAIGDIQLTEDLATTFGSAVSWELLSVESEEFTVSGTYNGASDTELLTGLDTLTAGNEGAVYVTVRVEPGSTLTGYTNQVTVTGTSPSGEMLEDDSTDGSDPDPNNDGNPDEMVETPIDFTEDAVLGVAKRLSEGPTNNEDGSYDMTFELRVENLGDVAIGDIQLTEDLATTFGSAASWELLSVESEEFTVSGTYNGASDTELLTGLDTLTSGNEGAVYVTVRVEPGSTLTGYTNQVTAIGTSPSGEMLEDDSTNGSDPDPNNDGNPDEMVETPIDFTEDAVLGVAKRLSEGPTNNEDGSYDMTFELRVENLGDVAIGDIQLTEDLATTFGSAASWELLSVESEEFTVSGTYNGASDTDLLTGLDTLTSGNEGAVYVTVRVEPGSTLTGYTNQVTATGTSPSGEMLEDDSTDGSDPDPNNDGNPDEMVETPIDFTEDAVLGVAKRLSEGPTNNEDGSYDMTFELRVENLGDVAIGDIQLTEDLATTFGSAASWELLSVESEEFTVSSTYNGAGDIDLLTGLDTLTSGNEGAVYVTVRVEPGSTLTGYTNQVTATGTSPSGEMLEDDSTNGSDPDPNNDGNPDEAIPTPVDFTEDAVLGVAKRVSEGPTNNEDGSYDMTFELRVENLGDVAIGDIQLTEDLATTFGSAVSWELLSVESEEFTVSSTYNGASDTELLTGLDTLTSGNEGAVYVTVRVEPGSTLTGYTNQVTATGTSPSGEMLEDDSTDGSDPDPNNDGNPDEMVETPIDFTEDAVLGVAKRVSEGPTNNEDGTYDMTFELRVENLGDVAIGDIQLTEDLATTFGSAASWELLSVESEEFTVSGTYNGASDTELLTGLDTLTSGNEGAVYVTVRVEPGSTLTGYTNQVTATGTSPSGEMLEDDSTNGSDPDPNNDGNPDEAIPTPVDFTEDAVLGVAKRLSEGPTNNEDGTYNMTFELRVENLGDVAIGDIQLTEDLATTFGSAVSWELLSVESEEFTVSGTYNGASDTDLLTGLDTLTSSNEGAIYVTVRVEPGSTLTGYTNQVTVTGTSPSGEMLEDDSTDGSDPDPNNDGNPDEMVETPIDFTEDAVLGVAKRVSEGPTNNEDGTYDMTFELRVENLGDVAIGDIQLTEDLATTFGSAASWELLSVESEEFTVSSTYNGASDTELLTGLDTLTSSNEGAIYVTVRVEPGSTLTGYTNQVTATGTSPSGEMLEDDSTDGSDPDPNNDGNPDEAVPTPIDFTEDAVLGVAKRVSQGPALDADNNYVLTYEIRVENLGNIAINNIQVLENLGLTFTPADSWMLIGVESEEFAINTDYDGLNDTELLIGNDILTAGNEGAIYVTVKVAPGGFSGYTILWCSRQIGM